MDPADALGLGPAALRAGYRAGLRSPGQVVDEVYRRIADRGHDGVWISLVPYAEARAAAEALDATRFAELPLFGVPFSVKDNIDVAGLETTAGCPEFGYVAAAHAPVVEALLAAGAILIGKTNLDQFATGLSGTRSPYGVPSNARNPVLIAGGSSSGAAVSVAAGLVGFALGTDTAGSVRVPAALNGLVGLKPSIGLASTRGVVPANRSLDCPGVLAGSVADAAAVLAVISGFDPRDPAARRLVVPGAVPAPLPLDGVRLAVPEVVDGWGSRGEEQAWIDLCKEVAEAGAELIPVDPAVLAETDRLWREGPFLAERVAGLDFVRTHPHALHPVTYDVLSPAVMIDAVEVYAGQARLRELARRAEDLFGVCDALLTPTVTETFTIAEMTEDPITLNARLGRFSTFTNLLDLCAAAVPAGGDRTPFGVTVHAPAGSDDLVTAIARAIEARLAGEDVPVAPQHKHAKVPEQRDPDLTPAVFPSPAPAPQALPLRLAVAGTHLAGMPLHDDLLAAGAEFERHTTTSADYRLFALAEGSRARSGLCRVDEGGSPIEVEVYRVPADRIGPFLAGVPAPLGIGRIRLDGGEDVLGFICEPVGLLGATDITSFRGWRAYQDWLGAPARS